jgi:DNA-binding response OmpR family regulator
MQKLGFMASFRKSCLVLAVDDDPRLLRLIQLTLRAEGYEVATAATGSNALDLLSLARPALVILDLNMPEMDGEILHDQMLQSGYDGPFMIVSADTSARMKSARMGVAFLQKPFDPTHLIEVVADVIQGTGQTSEAPTSSYGSRVPKKR